MRKTKTKTIIQSKTGQFSKREMQMTNKYIKMLNIISHQEMQLKSTLRFHLIPVRMAIIKKCFNNKCWQRCGEKRTLIHEYRISALI
jgi:hypothetical protein